MLYDLLTFFGTGTPISKILSLIVGFGFSGIIGYGFLKLVDLFIRPQVRHKRQSHPKQVRKIRRVILNSMFYYAVILIPTLLLLIILERCGFKTAWLSIPLVITGGLLLLAFIASGGTRYLNYSEFLKQKKKHQR